MCPKGSCVEGLVLSAVVRGEVFKRKWLDHKGDKFIKGLIHDGWSDWTKGRWWKLQEVEPSWRECVFGGVSLGTISSPWPLPLSYSPCFLATMLSFTCLPCHFVLPHYRPMAMGPVNLGNLWNYEVFCFLPQVFCCRDRNLINIYNIRIILYSACTPRLKENAARIERPLSKTGIELRARLYKFECVGFVTYSHVTLGRPYQLCTTFL